MRVPAIFRGRSSDLRSALNELSRSDTGRAAGLGAAVIVQNLLALVFTVVFARLLGASGYGSLAVLISAFIILMVPGSALQIAVARRVSGEIAAGSPEPGAGARRWLARLAAGTVLVAIVAIPLRSLIGALIDVDDLWGAAAVPVTAMLWVILCVERGVLQGFQRYRTIALSIVGEATSRIVFALALVGAGLDVTGAFLGSALSFVAVAVALLVALRPYLGPAAPKAGVEQRLRELLAGARFPVIGLTLLFALQEIHVILVKHEASDDAAGSWAVAAVAAKAIIWVAVGLGMYLVPEAARRSRTGIDARPILLRTLALVGAAGALMVVFYAVAGRLLLETVFGDDLTLASGALPWLGLAMVMLACSYLSVQYLLALGRAAFIWVLAAGVLAEVALVLLVGADLTAVALALLGVQTACAGIVLVLALGHPSSEVAAALPLDPLPTTDEADLAASSAR